MLKLVILACAIGGGPCETHWWGEPFRSVSGCQVAGYVAAGDWVLAHPGFVLRGTRCEPFGVELANAPPGR